ncbi:hypothetical protein TRFO_27478 [Tritrichomonas foetus]|uniref:Uncharacterized protein n=1 Tax=Tritrichomonas foetus TaxID=1144522 RepID=A0A1J4K2A8_9EUKA|nr:hypothetical protein TRFO_27478 [Tritrichomonas foetus]|eukprot:OHT04920.1 hypothetical protein TRFO_27478 [Tritrichomonas foetus]
MISYKEIASDNQQKFTNQINQRRYYDMCYPFYEKYYVEYKDQVSLICKIFLPRLISNVIKMIDISENLETIIECIVHLNDVNECMLLISKEFISTLIKIIFSDSLDNIIPNNTESNGGNNIDDEDENEETIKHLNHIRIKEYVIIIIRNLWRISPFLHELDITDFTIPQAESEFHYHFNPNSQQHYSNDDEIIYTNIFSHYFIEIVLTFFSFLEINSLCLAFDSLCQLLFKNSDYINPIISHGLVDSLSFLFQTDERSLQGRLNFPIFFAYYLCVGIELKSQYFKLLIEICMKYVSSQYLAPRELLTQALYQILKTENGKEEFFNNHEQNVKTIINAHFLNHAQQFKYLYKIDSILFDSGFSEQYFSHNFMNNLSRYVFKDLDKFQNSLTYVFEFLENEMPLIYYHLYNTVAYSSIRKCMIPIIERIMEVAEIAPAMIRIHAGSVISLFLLNVNDVIRKEIVQKGAFEIICNLVSNSCGKHLFNMLKALEMLLSSDVDLIFQAENFDLSNSLQSMENIEEQEKYLISVILNKLSQKNDE